MSGQPQSSLVDAFGLSFDELIPKHLVHKHSLDNVFLTDVKHAGENWLLCGARVPQTYSFFNQDGRSPSSDLLFYVEIGRQASLALSHSFFALPYDHAFVFDRSEITLLEPAWRSAGQRRRDRIVVEIKIKEQERRNNGTISRLVADYAFYGDEEQVSSAKGAWSLQTSALFQRLRRLSNRSLPVECKNESSRPLATASGCGDKPRANIVVSTPERKENDSDFSAGLIVDPNNPFFFDHPCDHVPGILLIEGCAQLAAQAAAQLAGKDPKGVLLYHSGLHFMQFVECHLPVEMRAHCNPAERGQGPIASPDSGYQHFAAGHGLGEGSCVHRVSLRIWRIEEWHNAGQRPMDCGWWRRFGNGRRLLSQATRH